MAYIPIKIDRTDTTSNQSPTLKSLASGLSDVLIPSEKRFGKDIAQGAYMLFGGKKEISKIVQQDIETGNRLVQMAKGVSDPDRKKKLLEMSIKAFKAAGKTSGDIVGEVRSKPQIAGDAAGTLLDILLFGTYGKATTGMKTLQLAPKVAKPLAKVAVNQTTKEALKNITKKTAVRSAVGGGTGYAYDISQSLQEGKTGVEALKPRMGALLGAAIPIGVGAIQAGSTITKVYSKKLATRYINSLVKPSKAGFSYGKDPGKTVSEMGIIGNSMDDFGNNITRAKGEVGQKIGDIYKNSVDKFDITNEVKKLDDAINKVAKGGKGNQKIVTNLINIKEALLYGAKVDASGNIVKARNKARNLSNLSADDVFQVKQLLASQTKFTGNPSDDKLVNSVLTDIYSGLKSTLNKKIAKTNPAILGLNEKYANLTAAELAVRNRDMILKRASMVSAPLKAGGAAGLITAIATGGRAIPSLLVATSAVALEKALESTPVKTRVAAWLAKESPSVVQSILTRNPGISTVLYRSFPKLGAQLDTGYSKRTNYIPIK